MQQRLLLLASLLLLAAGAEAAPAPPADTLVTYCDRYHHPLASAAGAALIVKTVPTSNGAGVEYTYLPDGWLLSRAEYVDLRKRQQEGRYEEYYEQSHQVKVVSQFQHNTLTGELLSYYPTGQLKRREQYVDYVSKGGQCFDLNGQPIAFAPYVVMAEYPGGFAELVRFVQRNVRYSRAERKAGHEGRPVVDFMVDEHGQVQGAHVREPGFPGLDAEALRVVQAMPAWQPARVEGVSDSMHFSLPVSFSLR